MRHVVSDVLFLHGRESGPLGNKARWLAAHFDAVTPQLETLGRLEAALPKARDALRLHAPKVVVGSSYGGAIAVQLAHEGLLPGVPLVLVAPAAKLLGAPSQLPASTRAVIFHAREDPIVPYADSVELADSPGTQVRLVTIDGDDHPLNGLLTDGRLGDAVRTFLEASRQESARHVV